MPTINTVRIIRHSADIMEKEVLKEFFRYIGLLFYDAPISSASDFSEEILEPRHKADIDIVLNCNDELEWLPPKYLRSVVSSTLVIQTQAETDNCRSFTISGNGSTKESAIFMDASDYYAALIGDIIEYIYLIKVATAESSEDIQSFNNAKSQMQQFLNTMINDDLFIYMQYKRSFRVLNLGAVIDGLDVRPSISSGDDPSGRFNLKLLTALSSLYKSFKDRAALKGQNYLLYAKANTIRKIKEIIKLMHFDVNSGALANFPQVSFEDQIALIHDIEMSGEMHIGTLFLGATICHATEGQQPHAEDYYRKLIVYASAYPSNRIPVFYSFFYYQYGRYLDRFWHNEEYAALCYQKAAQLDPRGYQARFMLGAFLVTQKRYCEATSYLQDALRILYGRGNQAKVFDCLSIKGIPYVFKTNYLLAQLCAYTGRNQECPYYFWGAEDAVDAFENIVAKISNDYSLKRDLNNHVANLFAQWDEAQRGGAPLRALKSVLNVGKQMMVH